MSVSLVSRNVARKLLLVQLLVVIASGLLFSLKDPFWGVLDKCGIAFFMFGTKTDKRTGETVVASGMLEEFEIAHRQGKYVFPVGVTGGGVGGFKGGILAADRYVGFGAGGSDTGTGCN